MNCSEIPDIVVAIYRNLSSGNLLTFLELISAAFIPFAIFLIEGNDKEDSEKEIFKVERAVMLKYIMHTQLLVISLFAGGIASLLFLDNAKCKASYLAINFVCILLYTFSVTSLLYIMHDIIKWISTSAKADDMNGFRFEKWKKYLEEVDDKDFHETWQKILGSNTIPSLLQPAYLSIFLDRINKQEDLDKYGSLSILRRNIANINISSPDVLEVIINTTPIDDRTIQLLSDICDILIAKEDAGLFFCLLDKKLAGEEDKSKIRLVINTLVFEKLTKYFDDHKALAGLLSGLPSNWKIDRLINDNNRVAAVMADYYLDWITEMIDRQEKDVKIAIETIDSINKTLVGDPLDIDLNKRLLADFCEVYGHWHRSIIPSKDGLFEEQLLSNYIGLGVRHFANFNCYTAYGEKNGEPDYEPSIQHQTEGSIRLLYVLFPQFMNNKEHLARMKKIIIAKLKSDPNNYRLKKLKNIYSQLDTYNKKRERH